MLGEVWRDIPGYEDLYQVSTMGRVKSLYRTVSYLNRNGTIVNRQYPSKILKPVLTTGGRFKVNLVQDGNKRNFHVHSLVLLAFVGPRPDDQECRHFPDRNQGNNRLDNLQYGTHQENINDKIFHKTELKGSHQNGAKLTEHDVVTICKKLDMRESISDIARCFKVSPVTIHNIKTGATWAWFTKRA